MRQRAFLNQTYKYRRSRSKVNETNNTILRLSATGRKDCLYHSTTFSPGGVTPSSINITIERSPIKSCLLPCHIQQVQALPFARDHRIVVTSTNTNNHMHFQRVCFSNTSSNFLQDQRADSFRYIEGTEHIKTTTHDDDDDVIKNDRSKKSIEVTSSSSSLLRDISADRIISIADNLESIPIGSIEDVHFGEACQVLNSMAHLNIILPDNNNKENNMETKKWDEKTRGYFAWLILKRLLLEKGCQYDETNGITKLHNLEKAAQSESSPTNLSVSTNSSSYHVQEQKASLTINSKVFHDAIKCMTKSQDTTLINLADDILQKLERHYLVTKSKMIHPVGRSYALLLDSMKDIEESNDTSDGMKIVDRVKGIMERIESQQEANNPYVTINAHLNNSALNTLAFHSKSNSGNPSVSNLVQSIISDPEAQLDQVSYSIAIKSLLSTHKWSDVIDETSGKTTAQGVEDIFILMQNRGFGNPNKITMTPILNQLSKDGNVNEVSNLLEWMQRMYETYGWKDIRPNNYHVNTMISALAKNNSDETVAVGSGHLALEILHKMRAMYEEEGDQDIRPDLVTYNAVLHAISKEVNGQNKFNSDIGERAASLLTRMETGEEGDHILPDIYSYNSVLSAFMNSSTKDAAEKSQQLLESMAEKDVDPNLLSYTICMNTIVKSRIQDSAQKVESLFRTLEKAYAEGNEELKPDIKCYNSVIHAWAISNEDGGVKRVHQILNEMQSLRESGKRPELVPDVAFLTSIISIIGDKNTKDCQPILDAILKIIKDGQGQGIELDIVAYNALIHAQSKQSGSATKAEMILNFMLDHDGTSKIRPNVVTFNTVIGAIGKSREKGASLRAEALLNKMQKMSEDGDKSVAPDTFTFASVLNAHANSGELDAAPKAEKILKHMYELYMDGNDRVRPNTICFATVIKAYSRSRANGAAERAEEILRWMFEVHEAGNNDIKPNTVSFTSVCDAWSKAKVDYAVKKVESLIQWMYDLSDRGYKDVYPNEYTYNSLLTAIARSKDPDKANRALKVLRYMQSNDRIKANNFNYNNLLLACAYTPAEEPASVRLNAIKIAIIAFEEALEHAGPKDRTNITFGIFFQACASLTLNEIEKAKIEKVIESVFRKCCEQGQVDQQLLRQLRKACTQQLYLKLFGNFKSFPQIKINDIPQEWKGNIRENRNRRVKR